MTLEFEGIQFPSAEARAYFINMAEADRQNWREKGAPMSLPVPTDIVVTPNIEQLPTQPRVPTPNPDQRSHRDQIIEAAEDYRVRGWAVVRLKSDVERSAADTCGKAAYDPAWTTARPDSPMPKFLPNNNLGIVLGPTSGDLVRPDFEWSAPHVAARLFPEPCPTFGRGGRVTGMLFVSKASKSEKYRLPDSMKEDPRLPKDKKDALLVAELLAKGKQSMVPPSRHPDTGEEIEWISNPPDIPELPPVEMDRRMRLYSLLAVTAGLGTNNESGWWRAIGLALAHLLLESLANYGTDEQRTALVDELVMATARDGGDTQWAVHRYAATTLDVVKGTSPEIGRSSLIELLALPSEVLTTFHEWLGRARQADISSESHQRKSEGRDNLPPLPGRESPDIFSRLATRMADLAIELLGEPNESLSTKSELRYGSKGSVSVQIEGTKAGCWYDHEKGTGGGALELIRQQKGLEGNAAIDWARQWLGISPTTSDKPRALGQPEPSAQPKGPGSEAPTPDYAQKVAAILSSSDGIAGTPAELYLHNRGITETPPDCIRFRHRAFGEYGALVALATDTDDNVLAVQQIYLTEDGAKAPLQIVKRTNKAVDGWAEKSAVRLPGTSPIILAEGPETALSIWQATGHETWACLGVANIGRAPVPEGSAIIIARDGDEKGSKADGKMSEAAASLLRRGHSVSIAAPPQGKDFNDVLVEEGADSIRRLIDEARPLDRVVSVDRSLDIGSDVEISQRVREDLIKRFGCIEHAEGGFWRYAGTHWELIPDHELRRAVHFYDGAGFFTPSGSPSRVSLGKGRIDSVLNECATLCADPTFFETRPTGINCASGFIRFSSDGIATIESHNRDHRCRHTLPGHWQIGASGVPPQDSLLLRPPGRCVPG